MNNTTTNSQKIKNYLTRDIKQVEAEYGFRYDYCIENLVKDVLSDWKDTIKENNLSTVEDQIDQLEFELDYAVRTLMNDYKETHSMFIKQLREKHLNK